MSDYTQEELALVLFIGNAFAEGPANPRVHFTPKGRYNAAFYAFRQLHVSGIMDITGIQHQHVAKQRMDGLIADGVFQVHSVEPGTPGYYMIKLTDKGQQLYEEEKQRLSSP